MDYSVIIPAAGCGTRAKLNKNKVLFVLDGKTVLERAVSAFLGVEGVSEVIVAASKTDMDEFRAILSPIDERIKIVEGGATRTQSVFNALKAASGDIAAIHDGARPFVTEELIVRTIAAAKKFGAAVPALPLKETVGFSCDGQTIDKATRGNMYSLQTPQCFKRELLSKAYAAISQGDEFTDDCGPYCKYIGKVALVEGDQKNIKLTYPEDFGSERRVGTGFDLHRLVEGRKLILGGVEIPHHKGLLGHSDADALTHAVMDAILSAVSERDIGYHFPDTDPAYKGADSMKLLEKVVEIAAKKGYRVSNLSATIMAEKPKLMKFVPAITASLAAALSVPDGDVGITCTTLEGLGIIGEEQAIAVNAYVMMKRV